jgi:hypothetical protein
MSTPLTTKYAAQIAAGNKLFNESTPEERKRIVAADVLDSLVLGTMTGCSHSYLEVQAGYDIAESIFGNASCHVCGIGAAALSMMRKLDHVTKDEICDKRMMGDGVMRDKLSKVFTYSEMQNIEYVFENWYNIDEYTGWDINWYDIAANYDNSAALAMIFLNIYQNNTFDLTKAPDLDALTTWTQLKKEQKDV